MQSLCISRDWVFSTACQCLACIFSYLINTSGKYGACRFDKKYIYLFQGELESLNSASNEINVLETELEVSCKAGTCLPIHILILDRIMVFCFYEDNAL